MLKRYCVLDLSILNTIEKLRKSGIDEAKINDYLIMVNSDRYDNFIAHGLKCAKCGLEAQFAAVEKEPKAKYYHINFYGVRAADNKELVLTKDHIFPKALGGFDSVENYQVLCESCNTKKGEKTELTTEQAIELGYTNAERANIMKRLNKAKQLRVKLDQIIGKLNREAHEINPPRDRTEFL